MVSPLQGRGQVRSQCNIHRAIKCRISSNGGDLKNDPSFLREWAEFCRSDGLHPSPQLKTALTHTYMHYIFCSFGKETLTRAVKYAYYSSLPSSELVFIRGTHQMLVGYIVSFAFTKANDKWTVKCKQKSRAQNTRQIPCAVLYRLPTGASAGYLHAGLDSSRWHTWPPWSSNLLF